MNEFLARISRVEAHELRPQDILCVHLKEAMPSRDKVINVQELVVEALRTRGLENTVFIFCRRRAARGAQARGRGASVRGLLCWFGWHRYEPYGSLSRRCHRCGWVVAR